MQFQETTLTRHAPDAVFRTYRDHLVDLVPELPDVERVTVRSRESYADGRIRQAHAWQGARTAVPLLIRPVIQPSWLQWTDDTTWFPDRLHAAWRIEVPAFGPAADIQGTYDFVAVRKGTEVKAVGDFRLVPERLPPQFREAAPLVERVVVSLLVPVVRKTGKAVATWMDRNR